MFYNVPLFPVNSAFFIKFMASILLIPLIIQRYFNVIAISLIFFLGVFLSPTLTTQRAAVERRGPSFTPLYYLHPLTNVQTFICNFACEMTITFFQLHCLYLPDCYLMIFTTLFNYHLID